MLNPKVDFAFKKLFASENHKDILIDFINAIVDEKDHVIDLEIKNPYNEKTFKESKLSILDIKAQSTSKTWFNIEMQVVGEDFYAKRTLYYWSKLYADQLSSGNSYDLLNKVICINILNFNHLNSNDYHNTYKIKHNKSNEILTDEFEVHFIELKKYQDNQFQTMLDRWTNFLKKAETYSSNTLPNELNEVSTIRKAFDILDKISMNEDERTVYENSLKQFRDEYMRLFNAESKGELKAKLNIARKMLENKEPVDKVILYSNLTIEQLKEYGLI